MKAISKTSKYVYLVLFILVLLFIFFTMDYNDGIVNSRIGYIICRSIFKGKFGRYFNSLNWLYGITIYFIYAIWSVPLVIIDLITGRKRDFQVDRSTILWYKILLLLFFLWCCYWVYRIVLQLLKDKEQSQLIVVLVATSPLFIFPPFALTQCDVISLSFILAGIYYLIQKKDKQFILFFAIAITMKYLALFIFIPLFFYRYKKARQMMIVGVSAASFLIISIIFMSFSKAFRYSLDNPAFYDVMAQIDTFLSGSTLTLGIGTSSIIVLYYVAICIVAHFLKPIDKSTYQGWILWLCLAGWYTLFIFFGAQTYWYILIVPFIVLIILNGREHLAFGLFAEIILTNVLLLERVCNQCWVMGNGDTFSRLMLRDVATGHSPILKVLFDRITNNGFTRFGPVYGSIILVFAFALLVIYRPKKNENEKTISTKPLKIAAWVQLVVLIFWVSMLIWGEVRLTKGETYTIYDCSYTEGIVIDRDTASIKKNETIDYRSNYMYKGMYELIVDATNMDSDSLAISYYYNEDIPIEYEIVEQTEEYMKVKFYLEEFRDFINIKITNSGKDDILFTSYTISEKLY